MNKEKNTEEFYDGYWPKNIPNYSRTRNHIRSLLPDRQFSLGLDGGCGTGVCSLALGEKIRKVVSCDLSFKSLEAAKSLRDSAVQKNIMFINASLLELPFKSESFDFILSWGAVHHTVDPRKAFSELSRVLKKGGCIVVAVYLKTNLTFIHEGVRKACLKMGKGILKKIFIEGVSFFVKAAAVFGRNNNLRDDNITIQAQVEDWFFVPEKYFFTIKEVKNIFLGLHLEFELLHKKVGRFKSSTNFIVRGTKL